MFKKQFCVLFLILIACTGNELTAQKARIEVKNLKKLSYQEETESENSFPLLNAQGEVLYFVKTFNETNVGGGLAGQDIWYIERLDSANWSKARNLTELNNNSNNVVVGVGTDNHTLYLLNSYSNPNRWDYGITTSTLQEDSTWSTPQELNLKFPNNGYFRSYYITPDQQAILLSTEGKKTYGKEDLYVYVKDKDKWRGPIHLNDTINTQGSEISPFITHDLKFLFFASDGHKGQGDFDIYVIQRLDESWENWSAPINLGKEINSPGFEAYLSTYPSGETFFASTGKGKKAQLYTCMMSVNIEKTDTIPSETIASIDSLPPKPVIRYTVQILALTEGNKPVKGFFKPLSKEPVMVNGKDGLDRYHIGDYSTIDEAVQAQLMLVKKGYADAFVRALYVYKKL